jgi:hypothetical protein
LDKVPIITLMDDAGETTTDNAATLIAGKLSRNCYGRSWSWMKLSGIAPSGAGCLRKSSAALLSGDALSGGAATSRLPPQH